MAKERQLDKELPKSDDKPLYGSDETAKDAAPAPKEEAQRRLLETMNQPVAGNVTGTEYAKKKGEDTVTMTFSRRLVVQVEGGIKIEFQKGRQEVPVSLRDHSYIKASGAKGG